MAHAFGAVDAPTGGVQFDPCPSALDPRPASLPGPFVFNATQQELRFGFDQNVGASLATSDLALKNVTTGERSTTRI